MRKLTGPVSYSVAAWIAFAAALHLYFAGFGYPEPLKLASVHLALFVPPIFLMYRARLASPVDRPSVLDWLFAVLAILPNVYVFFNAEHIYDRTTFIDPLTPMELVLGTIMVVLVVEAVRRALSTPLAVIVLVVLGYMALCHLLPGVWYSRPVSFSQMVEINYLLIGGGLYGPLTGMSATIVASFLIFGGFMQESGMSRLFTNFGAITAGRFVGGPAKVCVVTSGLFGTMSGSSVANVVVTGTMSIPLMKRIGFQPTLAAAIEAASSVGGAIMPPVMGAAAFIMAEMISVPYATIIKSAAVGAVLYYFSILVAVHFESKKLGIGAIPKEDLPTLRDILKDLHLTLPVILLVTLMVMKFSAYFAGFWATMAMVVASWLRRHTAMNSTAIFNAFVLGGRMVCIIAVAVTSAGIITAALTNTGLLLAFTGMIKAAAGGSLFILALLIATTCLFIGVGIPTTPAYIITAAIGAPLLAEYGVALISIHMFIFYFAVLADASPPVAPASDAAAAIAGSPIMRTGVHACRLAAGGFVVGLAFIYEPALILNGTLLQIVAVMIALATGLVLINVAFVGFTDGPLPMLLRLILFGIGGFCALGQMLATPARALLGVVALALLFTWSRWRFGLRSLPPAVINMRHH